MVDPDHPENAAAIGRLAPTGQFPVLVDGERTVIESAIPFPKLSPRLATIARVCSRDPQSPVSLTKRDHGARTFRSRAMIPTED